MGQSVLQIRDSPRARNRIYMSQYVIPIFGFLGNSGHRVERQVTCVGRTIDKEIILGG